MRDFFSSILISIFALLGFILFSYFSQRTHSLNINLNLILNNLSTVILLAILELSISFDNAIVNAKVLKKMSYFYKKLFFWIGLPIAVFGVRFLLPFILVDLSTPLNLTQAFMLAFHDPSQYQLAVTQNSGVLYSFGAGFLIMVFLSFLKQINSEKNFWLSLEKLKLLTLFFKIPGDLLLLGLIFSFVLFLLNKFNLNLAIAFYLGVLVQLGLHALGFKLSHLKLSGVLLLIYLEILDASFSLDGVLGAFAFTPDPIIMMTGLGIGAVFVRSLTLKLLNKNTLQNFIYLEHGAHYAMGILGLILFAEIFIHVPAALSAILSFSFIGKAFYDSKKYNKKFKI